MVGSNSTLCHVRFCIFICLFTTQQSARMSEAEQHNIWLFLNYEFLSVHKTNKHCRRIVSFYTEMLHRLLHLISTFEHELFFRSFADGCYNYTMK